MYDGREETVLLVLDTRKHEKCVAMMHEIEEGDKAGLILYKSDNKTYLLSSASIRSSLNPILGGFWRDEEQGFTIFISKTVSPDEMKDRLERIGFRSQMEVKTGKSRKEAVS